MKTTSVFTSTISQDILLWLNQYAKKTHRTKRDIIETALKKYKDEAKKEALKKTFIAANKDPEMAQMAEEGLDDYANQLKKYA